MKKPTIDENRRCPTCGLIENQINKGKNRSGTQKCLCKECGTNYTKDPKKWEYPEEVKELAIKTFYSGVSGRGAGNLFGMNKSNVYNWIKKTESLVDNSPKILEMDELYWFIGEKSDKETRENVYVITLVNREPRQIAGFEVSPQRIQVMVDEAPSAELYNTDGGLNYVDVIYPGRHVRNVHDKSDTFTVEGVNADLRHYIPLLRRRSRCFARSLETLQAVMDVFVDAYNRFGAAKSAFRQNRKCGNFPLGFVHFL